MALEKTFHVLTSRLRKLSDAVTEVRLTIVEDRPARNEVMIVDHFEYGVEDILGWLEESLKAASEAEHAVGHPLDLDRARRALSRCQELFQRTQRRYWSDLISYARLQELTAFGAQRRGEWQGWTESVKKGLEQCRQPFEESDVNVSQCWQELAERLGTTNVSVHTTSIGQQISSPELPGGDLAREGVT
jgi:hypothetical protein